MANTYNAVTKQDGGWWIGLATDTPHPIPENKDNLWSIPNATVQSTVVR